MKQQSVGEGTAWLMASVIVSVFSSYILHLGLAHFLGVEGYGTFGVLLSLYLINDAVLNVGVPRAVSKFISEARQKFWPIAKTSFKIQLLLSLLFSMLYVVFAKFLSTMLKDPSLANYVIFLGIMMVPLSFFSLLLSGYLNGLRLFREQAVIKTIFPILRTGLALLLVWAGWGIWGVLIAFLISIFIGLTMSYYYLRWQKKDLAAASADTNTILKFAFPLMGAVLAMALLRNINILFIKSFLVDNALVALYTAAFTLSNVSYLVFTALPLAITPAVSRAVSDNNTALVQKYISSSLRYALLLLLPLSALIAATAAHLLSWLYPSSYVQAGPLLVILIFGSTFLVLFSTLLSIITAGGKPIIELFFSVLFLGLLILLNFILIPRYGLLGSAYAQTGTAFIAFIGAVLFVYSKYKMLLPFSSVIKMAIASIAVYVLGSLWQYSGVFLLVNYAVLGLLYVLLLFLFGELRGEDWQLVKKVLRIKS